MPQYLPKVTSVSRTRLVPWLYQNLPAYVSDHSRLFRMRPIAYLRTLAAAVGMCWRYRDGWLAKPKKVYLKEFLQAGYIARDVLV